METAAWNHIFLCYISLLRFSIDNKNNNKINQQILDLEHEEEKQKKIRW